VRKFLRVLAFFGAVFGAAFCVVVLLHRAPRSPVAEWKQPNSIDYRSFDPYFLSVLRDDLDWSGFPLNVSRNYSIYVGRESGTPTYGHVVKFSFHPGTESNHDEEAHIKRSSVDWTEEGVTFQELSGHRLFIPKAMFIGGR
jgi:hypothetical protein